MIYVEMSRLSKFVVCAVEQAVWGDLHTHGLDQQ